MYARIEPSGCVVRKGLVQVRLSFYLEPGDAGYLEHHVQVPDMTGANYPGAVDAQGGPVDQADYDAWLATLPVSIQDNPFHNHFVYIDTDADLVALKTRAKQLLVQAYQKWSGGVTPDLKNPPSEFTANVDATRLQKLKAKLALVIKDTSQVRPD